MRELRVADDAEQARERVEYPGCDDTIRKAVRRAIRRTPLPQTVTPSSRLNVSRLLAVFSSRNNYYVRLELIHAPVEISTRLGRPVRTSELRGVAFEAHACTKKEDGTRR